MEECDKMADESVPIYTVTINGEERKAFDLVAIKQFLEDQRRRFSIMNMDPDNIDDNSSVHKYIASASINVLAELEGAIDQSLGLASGSSEEVAEESASEQQPEQPQQQEPPAQQESQQPQQQQPEQQPQQPQQQEQPEQPSPQPEVDETQDEITI